VVTISNKPILREIERHLKQLRRSERKVADLVLARPDEVIHMRIVDLASAAQVSEPTVVRFCRAIGCEGFQNFKVALAQSTAAIAHRTPGGNRYPGRGCVQNEGRRGRPAPEQTQPGIAVLAQPRLAGKG
jgi:DNA-binding MurR/RpiR family transcriptional regulator